jgi:hypothetical protein
MAWPGAGGVAAANSADFRWCPFEARLGAMQRSSLTHCMRSWIIMVTMTTVTATTDMPIRMAET